MRIGIITDVHANLPALEAALAALDGAGCDLIVHTGDAIGIGPHPAEVLDVLLGRPDVHCLMGNHDEWFAFGLPPSHREWMSPEEEVHQRWVHAGLREDLRAQVGAWPFAVEDEVEGIRLWFGHYPRASDGSGFASFVPEPVPSDLDRLFAPVQADLVFYGHHHPRSDLTGQRRYVNPGSLGCHAPGRARFAILDLERGAWDLRLEAVPYDPAPVLRDLEARDVPARETIRRIFFSDPP